MLQRVDPTAAPGSRTLILDAAQRLFAEAGYDATSTARIAEEAGVTRTLIFHYFPTKEEILATLLRERGIGAALDQVEIPRVTGNVEAALLALADEVDARLRVSRDLLQIVLHERSFQPLTHRLYEDFLHRLEAVVLVTVRSALGADKGAATVHAVANTFAAALLRDILIEPLLGVSSSCDQTARVCSLALTATDGPTTKEGS